MHFFLDNAKKIPRRKDRGISLLSQYAAHRLGNLGNQIFECLLGCAGQTADRHLWIELLKLVEQLFLARSQHLVGGGLFGGDIDAFPNELRNNRTLGFANRVGALLDRGSP